MKKIILLTFLPAVLFYITGKSQSLENADSYTVDQIYKKVEVDDGTLDPSGEPIDYIFTKSALKEGTYKIDLTDGPGDLYEIKGTEYYVSFNGYFGYAGYSTKCILKVKGGYYSPVVFKLE